MRFGLRSEQLTGRLPAMQVRSTDPTGRTTAARIVISALPGDPPERPLSRPSGRSEYDPLVTFPCSFFDRILPNVLL